MNPDFGLAIGPGPVYPVGTKDGVLTMSGSAASGGYATLKVLWIVDSAYPGPVLIRGAQLDGTSPVGFWGGPDPAPRMQLPPATSSGLWRDRPSYTRARTAGCYVWQVDGDDFSYPTVFRVAHQGST